MPVPHLHILHPAETHLPGIVIWMAEVDQMLRGDASWDITQRHSVQYDQQASFDVPTVIDRIRRAVGPAILVQKVQARIRERFESMLPRQVQVYHVPVSCAEDLWQACETARTAYEDGEPRIPL